MDNRDINTEDPGHETLGITAANTAYTPLETANLPPLFGTSTDVIIPMDPPTVRVPFPPTPRRIAAQDDEDLNNPHHLIERRHLSDFQSIFRVLKREFILFWNRWTRVQQGNKSSNFSQILEGVSSWEISQSSS